MRNKIIFTVLLCFCLIASLCACGSPSPTDTADKFLSAVKSGDQKTIKKVYSGETFDALASFDSDDSTDDIFDKAMSEKISQKLLDFDYVLKNEKIKGDKATVDVEITTYELGSVMKEFMSEYITEAFGLIFSNVSDEEMEAMANKIFMEKLDAATEKTYKDSTVINLKKVDGEWKVSEINDDSNLMNVMCGGIVDAIEDINKMFDEWE